MSNAGRLANAALNKAERGRAVTCRSGPTEAIVHVSDRCTFRCAMCMNTTSEVVWPAEGVHEDSGEFTLLLLESLLDTWPTLRSICFAGVGEPLLAADIRSMVETAHARGLHTEIVTNATNVAEHVEWMASGVLDSVSISLNAWDEVSVQQYCGVPAITLDRVKTGVSALVEAAEKTGSPKIEMSSVLWKSRRSEVEAIVAFAAGTGVKHLAFHNLIPSSLPGCGIEEVLGLEDEHWIADLGAIGERHGIAVAAPQLFDTNTAAGTCESPWRILYVDAAGGVSGCFRVEAPSLVHGDWRSKETWNGDYYASLRRSHLRSGERAKLPERCEQCVEVHGV